MSWETFLGWGSSVLLIETLTSHLSERFRRVLLIWFLFTFPPTRPPFFSIRLSCLSCCLLRHFPIYTPNRHLSNSTKRKGETLIYETGRKHKKWPPFNLSPPSSPPTYGKSERVNQPKRYSPAEKTIFGQIIRHGDEKISIWNRAIHRKKNWYILHSNFFFRNEFLSLTKAREKEKYSCVTWAYQVTFIITTTTINNA